MRIEICQLACPCVLPKMRYALLCNGEVTLATGPMCLAMQGVQRQELVEFPLLLKLSGTRQQDLAGDAFAADVCACCPVVSADARDPRQPSARPARASAQTHPRPRTTDRVGPAEGVWS